MKQNRLYLFPDEAADFHTNLRQSCHFECGMKTESSGPSAHLLFPSVFSLQSIDLNNQTLMTNQHRTIGIADYPLGNTAHEQTGQALPAMGTDHDQITCPFRGQMNNGLIGFSVLDK